jgi:acyl-CoA synthetase (AMP-forming)/AMP-acid ligase II
MMHYWDGSVTCFLGLSITASSHESLLHREGSMVATLAWNTTRHLETWFGIMGVGACCHTVNPRLSDKDIRYIINDAEVSHRGSQSLLFFCILQVSI